MDIEQIRLADIRNELLPCGLDVFIKRCDPDGNLSGTVFKFTRSDGNPLPKASLWIDDESISPTELAAIGRALQSAVGETMIPLREAVRVVVEACMSERRRCEGDYYGDMYGGAAIDGVEENAIAALQALGGGGVAG